MDLIQFKIGASIAILATGIIGGAIAFRLGKSSTGKRFFSLGNAFSGGIFLGAGLLHMLPDSENYFEKWLGHLDFPFAFFTAAAGVILILMIERGFHRGADLDHLSEEQEHQTISASYVLILVLSVHSFISGLALGAQDTVNESLVVFIAIVAHKGSAAFALGSNMIRAGVDKSRYQRMILLFSTMTPLGILLGTFVSRALSSQQAASFEAIFDGFASGTFLYIALIDVIGEEFGILKDIWAKISLVVLGFGVMAGLAIFL